MTQEIGLLRHMKGPNTYIVTLNQRSWVNDVEIYSTFFTNKGSRKIEAVRSAMPNLNSEVTLALFPTRLFFAAWSLYVFWLVVSSIFLIQRCATASRSLEYDCSAARPYRCAWRARTRRPHSHATSVRSTSQARLSRRRWSTSKLTEHRWKLSFKP